MIDRLIFWVSILTNQIKIEELKKHLKWEERAKSWKLYTAYCNKHKVISFWVSKAFSIIHILYIWNLFDYYVYFNMVSKNIPLDKVMSFFFYYFIFILNYDFK